MWKIEDVLSELEEEEENGGKLGLAAGFRFHPTDEELISYYLASKVFNHIPPSPNNFISFSALNIPQVDLNRIEPWDLPERGKMGEREWYFYSVRDRKYPTGLRTNRATVTGYWKATGKDKHVFSSSPNNNNNNNNNNSNNNNNNSNRDQSGGGLIGMKKTLVFYQGRAPRGLKTPWVMHEYRLDGHFSSFRLSSSKEEWVICRIFEKHGVGGNENKKAIRTSFRNCNNSMMINSSSLPPLLDTATTTAAAASMSAFPQPPMLFNNVDFGLHPITTTTCMKQEQNQQLNWLEKIITPQNQLFNNNPTHFYHHNPALGLCLDYNRRPGIALSESNQEFHGDFLNNANNLGIPDATASLVSLERLLDNHPFINLVP